MPVTINGSGTISGVPGAILQVVSTTKTDAFSASVAQGAFTAITGLEATITPRSTNSKILIVAQINFGGVDAQAGVAYRLKRGATTIPIGDAAGSRTRSYSNAIVGGSFWSEQQASAGITYLDSPSTVSAVTYSVDIGHHRSVTSTVYVNRSSVDTDAAYIHRATSTITLMEVAA